MRLRLAALLLVAALPAAAQTYPTKPVKLVVPFAAGGSTDIVARIIASGMVGPLGQQVVVENRGGAGGTLGADAVAKAPADGYTLLVATISTHAVAPNLMAKPPYDPVKDFTAITHMVNVPNVVVVTKDFPARDFAEFLTVLKANPDKYNFGSPGSGSIGHLQGSWFNTLAGVKTQHVPYRGAGPAMADLVAGNIQIMFDQVPPTVSQIRGGAIRALAVTTPARVPALPDVPAVGEVGMPEFLAYSWNLILGPPGLPAPVVEAVHKAALASLASDLVKTRMAELGAEIVAGGPADTQRLIASEVAKWKPIAAASGATIE